MPNQRILLVEDDLKLGQQVLDHLQGAGFVPTWVRDGEEALYMDASPFALLILDLMLPGTYGLDVLRHVRESSEVPVLILSAQNDTHVKVRALQLGADDYMTKPFWPEELIARVQARMRRPTTSGQDDMIVVGPMRLDPQGRRLELGGDVIELTRVEFDLLAYLVGRKGAAVQRGDLALAVLDAEREGTDRTLDVHISRLRKKLGDCGKWVATVWGVGYRFEPGGES
jgi:two-component system, OmpR family, response regulator MtrA